jgi:hypothetical protein
LENHLTVARAQIAQKLHNVVGKEVVVQLQLEMVAVSLFALLGGGGNGLMTYDRKVIKVDEKRVREANARICKSLK